MKVGDHPGPYLILDSLGAGGMGAVFRARDERLGREVAIKVLPGSFASDPDRLRRFEIEARAAGGLDHPNLLVIHDVGTHEGHPFLVSELLEGENLRTRLHRGPLPSSQTLAVASQIASGLAAAHEHNIIHRDLKPENLFLTKDGRTKILDFGLAKELPSKDGAIQDETFTQPNELTAPGRLLGTPGYMSPEQLRGQPVDHRSDIFAFGCVLFEMVSGRAPFTRPTMADTIAAILAEEPPLSGTWCHEVPPALVRIIRRCLEKRPGARFQSVRDIAFALEEISLTSGEVTTPQKPPGTKRSVLLAWAGVAVAGATVLGALFWARWRTPPTVPLDSRRIVVTVFNNQTDDPGLDPLGRMTSDWITQGLSRIKGLDVAPSTSVLVAQPAGAKGLGFPESAGDLLAHVAELTGAGVIVSGEYYQRGDSLQFQARVTDARAKRLLAALDPVSGPKSDPIQAIDVLRQRVMGSVAMLFEGYAGIADFKVDPTPPRYDSYLEFIAGFELFLTDDAEALRHFERAAALDPDQTAPLFYAAYILWQQGDYERVDQVIRSLSAKREKLTESGRHWLDGITAFSAHRFPDALNDIHQAWVLAPTDPLTVLWMGHLARLSNRPREAIDILSTMRQRPWGTHRVSTLVLMNLCAAYHVLGEYENELEEARRSFHPNPDPLLNADIEIRALSALGRESEARDILKKSLGIGPGGLTSLGELLLDSAQEFRAHGHRAASLEAASEAIGWFRQRFDAEPRRPVFAAGLLDSLRYAERWDEAFALCGDLIRASPDNAGLLGIQGALAARRGDKPTAQRIDRELAQMKGSYLFGTQTYGRACIAAQLGEEEQALALLRQAHAEGVPFNLRTHRDIDLEPLRKHPDLKDL